MGLQFGDDLFHAFLELSAVGGTGHHSSYVEGHDPFAAQGACLFGDDTQRQSFDDSGFTDTGFTDEDGVVLLAPTEYLDDTFDLHFASYDGVEQPLFGLFGEVVTVLVDRSRGTVLTVVALRLPTIVNIAHGLRTVLRVLGRVMRLTVYLDKFGIGDGPYVLEVHRGTVDLLAEDSQEQVDRGDSLGVIFAADAFGDAQDTLHLGTAGDGLRQPGFFDHEVIVQFFLRFDGIEEGLDEGIVG